jgi:hypothetical protein
VAETTSYGLTNLCAIEEFLKNIERRIQKIAKTLDLTCKRDVPKNNKKR